MGLDHVVVSRRQVLRLGSWVGAAAVPRFGIAAASRPGDREVIFYSPHPDDETLTLGVLVASHVLAGRKVHVVLFTDGRDSRAFPVVNARLKAEHRAPLTRAQFGAARVRECRAACAALGVPSANVHFEGLTAVTVANAGSRTRGTTRSAGPTPSPPTATSARRCGGCAGPTRRPTSTPGGGCPACTGASPPSTPADRGRRPRRRRHGPGWERQSRATTSGHRPTGATGSATPRWRPSSGPSRPTSGACCTVRRPDRPATTWPPESPAPGSAGEDGPVRTAHAETSEP